MWLEGASVGDIRAGDPPALGNLGASQERLPFLARASVYRGFCALLLFLHHKGKTPYLRVFWPPDAKSRLIGKDPDAGKDRRQKERRGGRQRMR